MLASLIAAFASGEAMNLVHRAKVATIAYALAALCGLCGLGFLVGAGYIVASRRYGSLEAAIGFGIGFIVLALFILAIRAIAARSRARRARRRGVDLAAIAGVAAMSVLPTLLKSRAGIIAPIVALAAYALYRENLGKKPTIPNSRRSPEPCGCVDDSHAGARNHTPIRHGRFGLHVQRFAGTSTFSAS